MACKETSEDNADTYRVYLLSEKIINQDVINKAILDRGAKVTTDVCELHPYREKHMLILLHRRSLQSCQRPHSLSLFKHPPASVTISSSILPQHSASCKWKCQRALYHRTDHCLDTLRTCPRSSGVWLYVTTAFLTLTGSSTSAAKGESSWNVPYIAVRSYSELNLLRNFNT